MRNSLMIISVLFAGAAIAWGADPLVGPGKAGVEKDAKGGVKGADTGAGRHLSFPANYERRGDSRAESIEKAREEKQEKTKKDAKAASKSR
jgi:hypothetical protein